MSVGKRLRFEVLKRDGFKCAYCGTTGEAKDLEVDHIVPRSKGGEDELANLITACRDCNRGKAALPLDDVRPAVSEAVVADLDERVTRSIKYAQLVVREREAEEYQIGVVMNTWGEVWHARHVDDRIVLDYGYFPERRSVRNLLARMPLERMVELMEDLPRRWPSPSDEAIRYWYGMCWRVVKTGDAEHRVAELEAEVARLTDETFALQLDAEDLYEKLRDRDERIAELTHYIETDRSSERLRYSAPVHISEILRSVS